MSSSKHINTLHKLHAAAVALAFGVSEKFLTDARYQDTQTHALGLWACQDNGFYGFAYRLVRTTEGRDWITNDRSPAWVLARWAEFERRRCPRHPMYQTAQERDHFEQLDASGVEQAISAGRLQAQIQ